MHGSCSGSNVAPIQRNGHRLFRSVSRCMLNTKGRQPEIRLSTVNKIINYWEHY